MKKSQFREAQIVGTFKEHEAGGGDQRYLPATRISPCDLYTWKAKFGGTQMSDCATAKRRALEDENRRSNASLPIRH